MTPSTVLYALRRFWAWQRRPQVGVYAECVAGALCLVASDVSAWQGRFAVASAFLLCALISGVDALRLARQVDRQRAVSAGQDRS
jgi:hypothetical protein